MTEINGKLFSKKALAGQWLFMEEGFECLENKFDDKIKALEGKIETLEKKDKPIERSAIQQIYDTFVVAEHQLSIGIINKEEFGLVQASFLHEVFGLLIDAEDALTRVRQIRRLKDTVLDRDANTDIKKDRLVNNMTEIMKDFMKKYFR